MKTSLNSRQNSIISYVRKGTTITNTFFLIFHIIFGIFFYENHFHFLYYYNYISITTYLIGYILLYKSISNPYIIMVNAEVFFFMILSVLCLGWDYGFQQYCIIFVASFLFTDYYTNKKRKLRKKTILFIGLNVCTYLFLRIWTYSHSPVYAISSLTPMHILFIINSIIAFTFLIAYSSIYSGTVFQLEKALLNAANIDPLTGLHNRRSMQELLNTINNDYCIAMIDIDSFKKINDTYGHDIGDEVIKTVASILLKKHSEKADFHVCRWGGEEFLILYHNPMLSDDEIFHEFDALRQQLANSVVICNNQEIHFTVTTGLSFFKDNLSSYDMIKIADENLYKGKESGKNVVVY